MAEATGDGARIDARSEQLGGHVVAKVVQAHAIEAGFAAQATPTPRDAVWSPRLAAIGLEGEHEPVRRELGGDRRSPVQAQRPVAGEALAGGVGQRHLPHESGLGLSLDQANVDATVDDGASERDRPGVEVDVGPAERDELGAPGTGGGGEADVHGEVDVVFVDQLHGLGQRCRLRRRDATGW